VFRLDEEILGRGEEGIMRSKIIEDIGEVRHTQAVQNGLSIAVELMGLSDSDINELICATNTASMKSGAGGQDASGMESGERESVRVQGNSIFE